MKKTSASKKPALYKQIVLSIAVLAAIGAGAASFPSAAEFPARPDAPDPLVMLDGTLVKAKRQWFKERRPELQALFQHYMYGWFPPPVNVTGEITYSDEKFFKGKATLTLATLRLGPAPSPQVHLLMVVPNHRKRAAPIFLGMNFGGNHTLVNDTNVPVCAAWMPTNIPHVHIVNHHATAEGRGKLIDTWSLEEIVDRGYAAATYFCGDVEMDRTNAGDGVRELIHPPREADDWGTIAAWAWGMQRVMDWLSTDRDIDKHRIALVGQSRFGKATILAAAFDDRVALAIPWQSGCGGTSPDRGKVAESVKQINDRFPEWFDDVFKEFNDQPERLPFDQNCLIALCAPRPVLVAETAGDRISTPAGAFRMTQEASGVYRLLGAEGLAAISLPRTNQLIDSTLGFYYGPGKHSPMTQADWKVCLDFADKHLAWHPRW